MNNAQRVIVGRRDAVGHRVEGTAGSRSATQLKRVGFATTQRSSAPRRQRCVLTHQRAKRVGFATTQRSSAPRRQRCVLTNQSAASQETPWLEIAIAIGRHWSATTAVEHAAAVAHAAAARHRTPSNTIMSRVQEQAARDRTPSCHVNRRSVPGHVLKALAPLLKHVDITFMYHRNT